MSYINYELSEAYIKNAAAGQKAQLLDAYKNQPAKSWLMIREIIRIAPKDSKPYTAIIYEFYKLLTIHGEFVISDLEKESGTNTLLNLCLKHVIISCKQNPEFVEFSPHLLDRIKKLYQQGIKHSPKKPLKKRDLPNSLKDIVIAWTVYSETFWAFDELLIIIKESPAEALEIIIKLLNKTQDNKIIAIIAAGPLESLLVDHGVDLKERIQQYAIFNDNLKTALASVWLDEEGDSFYPYWVKMMKDFGYWEMVSANTLEEE